MINGEELCEHPKCGNKGEYTIEVCSEEDQDNTFDVCFCRKHYIALLLYNDDDPSDYLMDYDPEGKDKNAPEI